MQGCHKQLTVKTGDQMEEVAVKAVLTLYEFLDEPAKIKAWENLQEVNS